MIKGVNYYYFSPTNTTKKIVEEIAKGIGNILKCENITFIKDNREKYDNSEEVLVIVGVPVYGGRVPKIILNTLKGIKGKGYVIPVVVYGNRAYEDALVELEDILLANGFKILAGGAFIGEHSYSKKVGTNRPDEKDLSIAYSFGKEIRKKLENKDISTPIFSGNRPYKADMPIRIFAPIPNEKCKMCMKCWKVCPVGAIDCNDPRNVNLEKCIHCYACVKVCNFNGREVINNPVQPIIEMLESKCLIRKEPEIFI